MYKKVKIMSLLATCRWLFGGCGLFSGCGARQLSFRFVGGAVDGTVGGALRRLYAHDVRVEMMCREVPWI